MITIGQKIDRLTILEDTGERKDRSIVWKCQCDCGNTCLKTSKWLGKKGKGLKSCGCTSGKKKNLICQKYGMLTVIDYTNDNRHGSALWKCQCDCGNICYASTNHLQTGNTKSCGCLHGHSWGEQKIKELLDKYEVPYKSEYIFQELPNRRYDFAIFDTNGNVVQLIEFDGEQHYFETPFFKTSLSEQKEIDKQKTDFAILKKIKLTRIPYWKREQLSFEDLEVEKI